MKLMTSPHTHPLSFRHRIESMYNPVIDRNFLLGYDPFDHRHRHSKRPPVNIREDEEYFEITLPLAGYQKNQVSIHIRNNVLTIFGKREVNLKPDTRYLLKEHSSESFRRSFLLSDTVDDDHISATFRNGILKIRLACNSSGTKTRTKAIPIL